MVTCPNGHANPQYQQYCGECGAPVVAPRQTVGAPAVSFQRVPAPPAGNWQGLGPPPSATWSGSSPPGTRTSRLAVPRWAWIATAGIAVVAVIALAVFLAVRPGGHPSDDLRWSAFPHTMGCVRNHIDVPPPDGPLDMYDLGLPDAARVTAITLTHLDGQRLKLSIQFLKAPPVAPRSVTSPINGQPMDEPGSLTYSLMLDSNNGEAVLMLRFESPTRDTPEWHFAPDEQIPEQADHAVLLSANTNGNVVDLVVDLDGQNGVLGHGPFRPGFDVGAMTKGPPDGVYPQGVPAFIDEQKCDWDNNASAQSGQGGTLNPPTPSVTSQPQHVPASTPASPAPMSPQPSLPDADEQGFLNYPGARCNYTNPAVVIAKTSDSLVVICQTGVGRYYYRGSVSRTACRSRSMIRCEAARDS